MKTVSLSGSPRVNVGKKDATALRSGNRVPAVVYGGKEQTHFHISEIEAKKIIFNPEVFKIELDIDGKKINAIVKDVQQHPVTDRIRHIDFMELDDKKVVKIQLPVRTKGIAPGVINGGRLLKVFRKLHVSALPGDLPAEIEVDISGLRIGHAVRISDLNYPGLKFLHNPQDVVVSVKTARAAIVEEETEESEAEGEETAAEGGEESKEEAAAE